jgi:hypothetical protein
MLIFHRVFRSQTSHVIERDALPRLDDTRKVIVVVGLVLVMNFIHSRKDIHRDLKLAGTFFNVLILDPFD